MEEEVFIGGMRTKSIIYILAAFLRWRFKEKVLLLRNSNERR